MLPALLNTPKTQQDWDAWGFHNLTSHQLIWQAISKQKGVSLTQYQLYPIAPNDFPGFLDRNSETHIEMNAVLGLLTTNLQDVDIRDKKQLDAWIYLHWQEHSNAEQKLGIGS